MFLYRRQRHVWFNAAIDNEGDAERTAQHCNLIPSLLECNKVTLSDKIRSRSNMSVKSRKYVSNFQKPCFLSTEYLRTEKRMLWKQSLILNTSHGRLAAVLRSAFIFSVAAQGFSEGLGRSKKEKWHKMPNRNFESFLKYSLILQLRIKRDYLGRQPPPPKWLSACATRCL